MDKIILMAFAPTVPMWEVWYDDDLNEIFTTPVLALALVQPVAVPLVKEDRFIEPHTLQDGYWIDNSGRPLSKDAVNLLGYSFEESPKIGDWVNSIFRFKEKQHGKESTGEG